MVALLKRSPPLADRQAREGEEGGLAGLTQGITPFSPSMAAREARLRPKPAGYRPLTAALRREAPCVGNPARFHSA